MIQVNQLAKSYGDQVLFEDASFTVGAGERIGLIGRNGSGKSTLLRILLGEELADKGEIKISLYGSKELRIVSPPLPA